MEYEYHALSTPVESVLRSITDACDNPISPGTETNIIIASEILRYAWSNLRDADQGHAQRLIPDLLYRLGMVAIRKGYGNGFTRCVHFLKDIALENAKMDEPRISAVTIAVIIHDLGGCCLQETLSKRASMILSCLMQIAKEERRQRVAIVYCTLDLAALSYRANAHVLKELTITLKRHFTLDDLSKGYQYAKENYPTSSEGIREFLTESHLLRAEVGSESPGSNCGISRV
jgi:hypothetical protein